jgi:hypothetical protein
MIVPKSIVSVASVKICKNTGQCARDCTLGLQRLQHSCRSDSATRFTLFQGRERRASRFSVCEYEKVTKKTKISLWSHHTTTLFERMDITCSLLTCLNEWMTVSEIKYKSWGCWIQMDCAQELIQVIAWYRRMCQVFVRMIACDLQRLWTRMDHISATGLRSRVFESTRASHS